MNNYRLAISSRQSNVTTAWLWSGKNAEIGMVVLRHVYLLLALINIKMALTLRLYMCMFSCHGFNKCLGLNRKLNRTRH